MTSIIKVNTIQDVGGNNLLISNGSGSITTNNIGGQNTPAFEATISSNQAISNSTNTKASFNTENFDTNSCYDHSSNYRFTPNVAGKYYVYVSLYVDSMSASNFNNGDAVIKKNGSTISNGLHNFSNNPPKGLAITISTILDMNGSSDYVEIFGSVTTINNNGGQFLSGDLSVFGAYRIIGA